MTMSIVRGAFSETRSRSVAISSTHISASSRHDGSDSLFYEFVRPAENEYPRRSGRSQVRGRLSVGLTRFDVLTSLSGGARITDSYVFELYPTAGAAPLLRGRTVSPTAVSNFRYKNGLAGRDDRACYVSRGSRASRRLAPSRDPQTASHLHAMMTFVATTTTSAVQNWPS
jgi:hypothetical protein